MRERQRSEWVGDVFSKERFDALSEEELAALFAPPPEYGALVGRSNHFLLGAKGSGKSTALRSLSFPVQVQQSRTPTFAGIYIGLRHDALSSLRTAAVEVGNPDLFEHFFASTVLLELAHQWRQVRQVPSCREHVPDLIAALLGLRTGTLDLNALIANLTHDRVACLTAAKRTPLSRPADLSLRGPTDISFTTVEMLGEFARTSSLLDTSTAGRIGLLIDSLDHYGELAHRILSLFEADTTSSIVMKVAARTIDIPTLFEDSPTRPLELHRDYELISLDRRPDSPEHHDLLSAAIVRRARFLGPELLADLTDSDILSTLFDSNGANLPLDTSFESLARYTSGNVLSMIVLMDSAAAIERQKPKTPSGLSPVTAASRAEALRVLSTEYWQFEIGQSAPMETKRVRTLCEVLLAREVEKVKNGDVARAPSFRITNIGLEDATLLRRLVSERLLVLANDGTHALLQAGLGELEELRCEVNRLLLPIKKISSAPNIVGYHATWSTITDRMDSYMAIHTPMHTTARDVGVPTLFGIRPPIFISRSLSKRYAVRTNILRQHLDTLFKEENGRQPEKGEAWMDIDLVLNAASFRKDIRKAILQCRALIGDITDAGSSPERSAGVFYEIGLAFAALKPIGLFHNERSDERISLRMENLPTPLTARNILIFRDGEANFLRRRLAPYIAALDAQIVPESRPPADGGDANNNPYVFVSTQPRNSQMRGVIQAVVDEILPDHQILDAHAAGDELDDLRDLINGANACLIDATDAINTACLELGLAAFEPTAER
jgi:hypothetical protein